MTKKFIIVVLIISSLFIGQMSIQAQDAAVTISIPSIHVTAPIVHAPYSLELGTWDVSHLYMNVGHMEFTPWVGMGGNIVLGAHSETIGEAAPDIFYNLNAVRVGDEIIITIDGVNYVYRVVKTRTVASTDISILNATSTEVLTLFTCDIGSYGGNGKYGRRHVVIAQRIG